MSPNDTQKATIATLNSLIETTRDGEKGFHDAARHAHAPELRNLMSSYAADCARSATELQDCVSGLGGLGLEEALARAARACRLRLFSAKAVATAIAAAAAAKGAKGTVDFCEPVPIFAVSCTLAHMHIAA